MRVGGIALSSIVVGFAVGGALIGAPRVATAGGAATPATPAAAGPVAPAAPAVGAPAAATFEELLAGATRLDRKELGGWAWALTAACDQGDPLAQRQCRVIRDARAAQLAGETFVIEADPAAFVAGAWDAAKKSIPLTVHGCIACAAPVDAGGKKLYIVANAASPQITGDTVLAASVHDTARAFDDQAAADAWKADKAGHLGVELVFKLPAGNPAWSRGGKDGLAVQVLGFRVHDPCDGAIVCASPSAQKVDADPKACGKTVDEGAAKPGDPGGGDAAPAEDLVDRLEPWMIQKALAPAVSAANRCHDTYGVDGSAKLKITISGEGKVSALEQTGDFADTPTGACIAKAIKATTFPKSRKAQTTVTYPIVLR